MTGFPLRIGRCIVTRRPQTPGFRIKEMGTPPLRYWIAPEARPEAGYWRDRLRDAAMLARRISRTINRD